MVENGVQCCSRCGTVLCETSGGVAAVVQRPRPLQSLSGVHFWEVGASVATGGAGWWLMRKDLADDAVPCGAGL
jgi:hypothetical protein